MELYYKYQPVTWDIGVIEALPDAVVEVVWHRYIPRDRLDGIYRKKLSIDKGLVLLEPLGALTKFLLFETIDKRTVLFSNFLMGAVDLPTWNVSDDLGVSAYYVCNVPNTISKDQRSGACGARILEYRTIETPFNQEPKFGIHLINDAGHWCFYRFGEKLPFENKKTYKSYRKTDRFTVDMLVDYCRALGIPVYDKSYYSDKCILVEKKLKLGENGLSYEKARVKLRIEQDNRQGQLSNK